MKACCPDRPDIGAVIGRPNPDAHRAAFVRAERLLAIG
jgi:hypothetical protein